MAKTGCNSALLDLTAFFAGKRDVGKKNPQLTRMIYNALDEINGLLGRSWHFSEGAQEVPPKEVNSVLRPADNEPFRELG